MAEFPICVTCKQTFGYRGPKPNLLPCLHPVCDDCVQSATDNLKCTNCLKEFIKANISLARDVVREREIFHLTVKHRPSELLCTNKDDGNQAVSWCQNCREMFCEHCQISHDEVKVTREHSMKRLEEMVSIEAWGDDPLICPKHLDQAMEMYDKNCHQPMCFKCLYQDHSEHETVGIIDHMASFREKIQQHRNYIREQKDRVDELRNTSVRQRDTLHERAVLLRDNVSQMFAEIRTLVNQRQEEVLLELDKSINIVEEQHNQVEDELQQMNTDFGTKTNTC